MGAVLVFIENFITIKKSNLSLGVFQISMKAAVVKGLIKTHTLDCNILNKYRPVSNLIFVSKTIEKPLLSI